MFACCRGGRTCDDYGHLDEEWLHRNSSLSAVELLQVQSRFKAQATLGGVAHESASPQSTLRLQTVTLATSALLDLQNKARTKGFTFFVSGKYKQARKLLEAELTKGDAEMLEGAATGLHVSLENVRLLLVDLLFNRDYWHPSVPGGGLHTLWNDMPDGFDGMMDGVPIEYPDPITGESTLVPGFDGIPYQTLRGGIVDAWRPVQAETQVLADLVQRFSDHFYSKIEGTPLDMNSIKAPVGTTQFVPEECEGQAYTVLYGTDHAESTDVLLTEIRDATALLSEALSVSKKKAAQLLPGIDPASFSRLKRLVNLSMAPNRHSYYSYFFAKHINKCKRFDTIVGAAIIQAGAVPLKAPFKLIDRVHNKVQAEYTTGPKPYLHRVTDLLRMGAVVKDHKSMQIAVGQFAQQFPFLKLKNRLAGPTHDVLVVFDFEGVLVEVQFSFAKINTVKLFSHVAYDYSRINLGAINAMEAILTAAFVGLPRNGPFYIGGYGAMKPEQIQLKAVLK